MDAASIIGAGKDESFTLFQLLDVNFGDGEGAQDFTDSDEEEDEEEMEADGGTELAAITSTKPSSSISAPVGAPGSIFDALFGAAADAANKPKETPQVRLLAIRS